MKSGNWFSTTYEICRWLKRHGGKRTIEALAWRVQTATRKRIIQLQDKLGWYTYKNWIKENNLLLSLQKAK